MPITHIFLAFLVATVWGINFLFVKIGLEEISPLLLCTLRFVFASVPAIFFIKPPAIPFKWVLSYGLFMFALQFSLLFLGMHAGMTPGMASLLSQVQVFFSLFFANVFLKERPHSMQLVGALVSFTGIALVALHFDENMSLLGFILILGSAATWGLGNLITKKVKSINMIALVIWGSFVAILPMFTLSLIFEGYESMVNSFHQLSWRGAGALVYIVYMSTWVGYGVWNWLMNRYPVSMIVPFTLLIPVVGLISSILVLGEPVESWKFEAGALVLSGLGLNLFFARMVALKAKAF